MSINDRAALDYDGSWYDLAPLTFTKFPSCIADPTASSQLIFSIPTLVAYLSSICRLYPGDLVFTETPSGVGMARGRYLAPGETIVSSAELIGELHNACRAGTGPLPT